MTSTTAELRARASGGYAATTPIRGQGIVAAYTGITALVLALLMVFGLLMKASQAGLVTVPANRFYQLLTAHGIGMVAISGLGGAAVMVVLPLALREPQPHDPSRQPRLLLIGVVLVLGAIFIGGFAAAWTFLFPLPAHSQGVWGLGRPRHISSACLSWASGSYCSFSTQVARSSPSTVVWDARWVGRRRSVTQPRPRRRRRSLQAPS
jgi:cytochrome c oxidase subunit 1